jgi:hypothetical protein
MSENENAHCNSGSDGNGIRNPRPNIPRTRSVAGPRPLPSGSNNYPKESRDSPYQNQRQYSTSGVPEYYYVPPQDSNPQNSTPDQPFPPLVAPKPQKPMPTVTNDIANALETQYPEDLNGYEVTPSDTPKSWYKGDDEKLNLASDQNQNSPLQNNTELQPNITKENQNQKSDQGYQLQRGTNELPSHDNIISNNQKFQNMNNQTYQYSNSPPKQFNQQQQQQQMYYQKFSPLHQQNYNNFQPQQYQNEQYQATLTNGNLQSERNFCKSFPK